MVVVHSRRSGRAKVPVEGAGEFVTVSRKQVKGASVGNIWRVLAEVLVKFSGPGEGSQLSRVSEKGRVCVNSALVHRLLSFNASRESPVERHDLAGCCRSACRDKHCRKAGEEKRDQNPCRWFELNVSIFHKLISFSCFGFQ